MTSDRYDSASIKEVLLYSLFFFLNGINYFCSLCQRIKIIQCTIGVVQFIVTIIHLHAIGQITLAIEKIQYNALALQKV